MESRERSVIVALDDTSMELEDVRRFAESMSGRVWGFKVHALVDKFGPEVIGLLKQFGKVFVDMKLHDIPKTMTERMDTYVKLGADLVTVARFCRRSEPKSSPRGWKRARRRCDATYVRPRFIAGVTTRCGRL